MKARDQLRDFLAKQSDEDVKKKTNQKQIISVFFQDCFDCEEKDGYWQFNQFCKTLQTQNYSICSKFINKGSLSFVCKQCFLDTESAILCEACYLKGNHQGHLVLASTEILGICDCGDLNAITQCCSDHQQQKQQLSQENQIKYHELDQRLELAFEYIKSQKVASIIYDLLVFMSKYNENLKQYLANYLTYNHLVKMFKQSAISCDNIVLLLLKLNDNFFNDVIQAYTESFEHFFQFEPNQIRVNQGVFQLYTQFFTKSSSQKLTSDQNFYQPAFRVTQKILNFFFSEPKKSRYAYNAFLQIKQFYMFIITKNNVFNNTNKKDFISKLVDLGFFCQCSQSKILEDEIEKFRLHIECTLLNLFRLSLQKSQISDYTDILLDILSKLKFGNNDKNQSEWPIHNVGFRMLGLVLAQLCENHKELKQFLIDKHYQSEQKMIEQFQEIIRVILLGINFSRLQDQKVGEFMSMIEDPIKSMKIEIVNSFYKKSYYGQYDADITIVQILISLIPLPCIPLIALNLDLKQVYFQHNQESYRKLYYNFFHLLNVLLTDMTCYANVVVNKPDVQQIVKFVIINAFHFTKVKDMLTLKSVLFDKILNYQIHIENIVTEVSDQIGDNLRLKKQYSDYFDPFIFHKYTRLTQDLYDQKKLDLIGSGREIGNYEYIVNLQLFSDIELVRLLIVNIKLDGFAKQYDIIKITLRLIGVYFKFCTHYLNSFQTLEHPLIINLEKVVLKQENLQKMQELKKSHSEFKDSLEKITILYNETYQLLKQKKEDDLESQKSIKQDQQTQNKPNKNMKRKQEQLRKQFMDKQKKFQNQNEQVLNQMQIESSQNELCYYCKEHLDKNQVYGVCAFISKDNIGEHCRQFQEKSKRKSNIDDPEFSAYFKTYSISSCNHLVHQECHEKNKKRVLKKLKDQEYIFNTPIDFVCGHCYFLSNIFVYMIDEYELQDKNLNQQFFDTVYQLLLQEEQFMTGDITQKGEYYLQETALSLVQNMINQIHLAGIHFYMIKDLKLYKNMFYHIKYYLHQHHPKYLQIITKQVEQDLQQLTYYINGEFLNSSIFPTLAHAEKKLFEIILFQTIIEQKNICRLTIKTLQLLQNYISFKITLQYHQYVQKKEPSIIKFQLTQYGVKGKTEIQIENEHQQYEKIPESKNFEILMNDEDFKSEMLFYILPLYRKLAGVFTTLFQLPPLDPSNCSSDIEEIDFYTNFLHNLGGEILTELKPLNHFLEQQNEIQIKFLRNLTKSNFSPFFISQLPNSYEEFLINHITLQCNLCKKIPENAQPYLCLICDKVFCSVKCTGLDKKPGNLSEHTKKQHSGKCAFIHLHSGLVIISSTTKLIKYKHLYKDKFGQLPNLRSDIPFEKFMIDRKIYNKVSDIIVNNRIPQEVTYNLLSNPSILFETNYM